MEILFAAAYYMMAIQQLHTLGPAEYMACMNEFSIHDSDGNNELNQDEFGNQSSFPTTPFNVMDLDSNEAITIDEWSLRCAQKYW